MSKISSEARGYDKIMPDIFILLIFYQTVFKVHDISDCATIHPCIFSYLGN